MAESRGDPLRHLGLNGSFRQSEIGGDFGVAGRRGTDGKINRRNVRLETVVVFQWVTTRFRDVRYFPAMCAKARNRIFNQYNQRDDRNV